MPLVNLKEILRPAMEGNYAVGNFDVFNIEMLKGVIDAAEETRSPAILAWCGEYKPISDISLFAPALVRAAQTASVPVAVHLDHALNTSIILKAIHYGFTSVMIDASDKPYEENVRITRQIVEMSKDFDVSVEAELGHVSGNEVMYENDEYVYTDAAEAARFVKETGIDALAVAIGTVHGVYKSAPKLSLSRLTEINDVAGVPLVLHGGSGLSDDDFRSVIKHGVAKINIFTDLTLAARDALRQNAADDKCSYMGLCLKSAEAVKENVIKKMTLFGSCGKA